MIRSISFCVALIVKIKKSIDQTEEAKTTIKIGGGLTMISMITFASIQTYNWIHKEDIVLVYQINFIASYVIFGIIIPFIIIKRNENMTLYLKSNMRKCFRSPDDENLQTDNVNLVVIPNAQTLNNSIMHNENTNGSLSL